MMYYVIIPDPIDIGEKKLREIINDGIEGAWINPIIVLSCEKRENDSKEKCQK